MQPAIIKKSRVRVLDELASAAADLAAVDANEPTPAKCEKSVRLLEQEGQPHAIELTCSCGEVSLIALEFATSPAPDPVPSATDRPEARDEA